MPGPGGMSGRLPAALNISGTPLATPRPTRKSPTSAAAGCPSTASRRAGSPVSSAPAAQQGHRADPAVDGVADDAADGHAGGEERVRERRQRGARTEVVAQVDPAPVGHRALGDHHQEAEDGEQHDAARGSVKPGVPSPSAAEPCPSREARRAAASSSSALAIATVIRGSTPRAASAAANAAPAMPPNAQPAWSEDMIGRPSALLDARRRGCSSTRPSWRWRRPSTNSPAHQHRVRARARAG